MRPLPPLELDPDVSAAPTDYVQWVLRGVPRGGQAARLRAELDRVTGETVRLKGKLDELRAKNVPPTHPQVQALQRRIQGTDAEVRRWGGAPARDSLEDRADQLRVALEPPRTGELRRQTRREQRGLSLQAPTPTPVQEWASGWGPGLQHAVGVKFSMMESGRQADLTSARRAEQDADRAAQLPRPGTRGFKEMAPAATVMARFFPADKRYPAAEVDRIVASPEFRRTRKGMPAQTGQYVDRMVARLRARNGRSTDANEGTAEAAGLVADVAGDKLFGLVGEWARGLSRAKAVAKYGAETVAEAEKRGLLASIRAGGKTLVQDTKIRARIGAAPGAATMAGYNMVNEVVAGDPKRSPLKLATDVGWAGAKGALQGAAGSVVSDTLAPMRGKGSARTVRAGQEVARGGLNFGVVEPAGALLEGERDPKKLLDRFLGGLLFGAALHTPQAGKQLVTRPKVETAARKEGITAAPALQPGDRVRVATKPELGTATVREVVGGFAVLRPENKPRGTGVVKIRVHELEPVPGSSLPVPTTQPKLSVVLRPRELDSQTLLPIEGQLQRKLSLYDLAEEQRQVLHDHVNENKAKVPIEVRRFDLEHPEPMLTMPYESWTFHFPDTPGGHEQVVSTLHSLYAGRQLPPELRRHTQKFYFSSQPSARDDYWRQETGNATFWAKAGGGGGDVIAYRGSKLSTGDVAHELAHNMAQGRWGSFYPPVESDYAAAIRSGEPIPTQHAYNEAEDFAMGVQLYVTLPKLLKQISPRRFQVLDRMMRDVSYGG